MFFEDSCRLCHNVVVERSFQSSNLIFNTGEIWKYGKNESQNHKCINKIRPKTSHFWEINLSCSHEK